MDKQDWNEYIEYVEHWAKDYKTRVGASDGPMSFDDWCDMKYLKEDGDE